MRVVLLLVLAVAFCALADTAAYASASPEGRASIQQLLQSTLSPNAPESAGLEAMELELEGQHAAEKTFMCLSSSTICGYNPLRAGLTCCHEPSYHGHYDRPRKSDLTDVLSGVNEPTVGNCQLTLAEWAVERLSPLVWSLGTVPLSCKLDGEDTCGLSGCGGLSLTAPVDVYVTMAVVEGNPNMRPFLYKEECYASSYVRRNGLEENVRLTLKDRVPFNLTEIEELVQRTPPPTNMGGIRRAGESNMGDEMVTLVFPAILSGPVTVSKKQHSAKWEKGSVEYMLPLYSMSVPAYCIPVIEDYLSAQIPSADPEDFNAWKFHLTPNKGYY